MKSGTIIVLLAVLCVPLHAAFGQAPLTAGKLTPRALAAVREAQPSDSVKLWLYLDSTAWDSGKVRLSERARLRRARVDPVNFLVEEHDYPISDSALTALRNAGVTVRHVCKWLRAVSVRSDRLALDRAAALPSVRKIDLVKTLVMPVDEDIASLKPLPAPKTVVDFNYGLSALQNHFTNAVKLHRADLTGQGVLIAMLDTGFDPSHPAFASAAVDATHDFINGDAFVDEIECPEESPNSHQSFHGTATWSVIGGYSPDTLVGVAPDAEFILFKTEITCGGTEIKVEEDNWIAAADSAEARGADIINSSLGYAFFTDYGSYTFDDLDGNTALITVAADVAASKNVLVVTSAGNERATLWNHILAPADGDSVVAVGAATADSSLAVFSSPGPTADGRIKPDITTLGTGVVAAFHLGGYGAFNGTSLSAPLTAGCAALALQHDPTLTAAELVDLIRRTGSMSQFPDNDFGYGLLDAAAAADIIKFDPPFNLRVTIGLTETLAISTSGRTDSIPALEAFGLPPWAELLENGDGTGVLRITAPLGGPPTDSFYMAADVGYFVDTATFTITKVNTDQFVTAGPNPFTEFVDIFVSSAAGDPVSVSIFNVAGERIWEQVNNLPASADEYTIRWYGRNQSGKAVAPGAYILLVVTDLQTYRIKLLKSQ
ncbi:MAG: S8 family peptidase [Candidatus Zixiibacteriota bacterium]|nr:MAG: S8 family peptidase [candidate division Zixibacteria bacterium]